MQQHSYVMLYYSFTSNSNVRESHTKVDGIDLCIDIQDEIHLEWLTLTMKSWNYDEKNKPHA